MDKIAGCLAEKVGDVVEDTIRGILGVEDKDDKKEEEGGGGFLSIFRGNKTDDDKKGPFPFGNDKKKDEDRGGFFSNLRKRGDDDDDDDDDEGKPKKSGFAGLFSEQEAGSAAGGCGSQGDISGAGGGIAVGRNDGDLLDDLMAVAEETSSDK